MNAIFTVVFFISAVVLLIIQPNGFLSALLEGSAKSATVCVSLLATYAVWLGLRMIPYTSICGVFRAGGDTVTGCIYELCSMYIFSIPVVIVLGLFTEIPFVPLVLCMYCCEDLPKGILCIRHLLRGKWIKQITKASVKSSLE